MKSLAASAATQAALAAKPPPAPTLKIIKEGTDASAETAKTLKERAPLPAEPASGLFRLARTVNDGWEDYDDGLPQQCYGTDGHLLHARRHTEPYDPEVMTPSLVAIQPWNPAQRDAHMRAFVEEFIVPRMLDEELHVPERVPSKDARGNDTVAYSVPQPPNHLRQSEIPTLHAAATLA